MVRVYCAGPFFNEEERAMMLQVSNTMESVGYQTYLAQRDGLESGQLLKLLSDRTGDESKATGLLHRLVFSMDIYRLLEWSDVVVANLNGRVPDEGTVVECALAWHIGKPLVFFKNDWRAPFSGRDNLMLSCLTEGHYCSSLAQVLERTMILLSESKPLKPVREIAIGRQLVASLSPDNAVTESMISEWLREIEQHNWQTKTC